MSSSCPPPVEEPSTASTVLSKELSKRVPPEIWRKIAALTVDQYHILLIENSVQADSKEPLVEVNIDKNYVRHLLDICLVSKAFKEGVRSGFRNHFSGCLYFWFGSFRPEVCTLIKTKIAPHVRQLDIHMSNTDPQTLGAFNLEWSQFIRSAGFAHLREVRVFAPYTVNADEYESFSEQEMDNRVEEETARIKSVVAEAGLDAGIPYMFQIHAYIRGYQFPGLDAVVDWSYLTGVIGRPIASHWQRKCNMPVSCRQLVWLWFVDENKPAST